MKEEKLAHLLLRSFIPEMEEKLTENVAGRIIEKRVGTTPSYLHREAAIGLQFDVDPRIDWSPNRKYGGEGLHTRRGWPRNVVNDRGMAEDRFKFGTPSSV